MEVISIKPTTLPGNRRFNPNLQKKSFYVPETNEWVELKVTAKALRTIDKLGLFDYLKKLDKKANS